MGSFSGALGSLWVEVGAKISQFEDAMAAVGKTIDNTLKDAEAKFQGFAQIGSVMAGIGGSLTQSLTLPLVGLGIAATKMQGDFEHAMNKISALGNITGKDLEMLEAKAVDLGAKTQFSGKQAAEGMAELAAAGQSAQQIFSSMPGVLNLAAAGEVSIAQAAKIATDAISQFGLSVSDSAHVADVLAQAAASGKDSVQGVGLALGYVGGSAHAAGLSMEETTAALTLLAEGGLRGERAGTALNAILIRLVKPTKQAGDALAELGVSTTDAQGKLLPLSGILDQLKDKNLSLADAAKIAGVEHAAALANLAQQGGGALNKLTAELQKASEATGGFSGAADKMAQTINKGIGGALERMRGSIETAGQSLGKILEPAIISISGFIEKAANALSGFAQFFSQLPGPIQTAAGAFVVLAAAVGPVLLVLGSLISSVGLVGSAFATLGAGGGITALITGFTTLASTAIPSVISALGTFVTTTIPAALSAIGKLSVALITEAAGSLTTFATTAIPAAIKSLATFATTAIPAATAALIEFATTGFTSAAASVSTFATVTIPGAIASLRTLSTAAIPAAIQALAALGVAVGLAASAFAGWQLGKWLDNNVPAVHRLSTAFADLLLKIPLVTPILLSMTGASDQATKANAQLAGATQKLQESLAKHGVVVSQAGLSADEYAKKLRDSMASVAGLTTATGTGGASLDKYGALLKSIGVISDSELKPKLAALQAKLKALDDGYKAGKISAGELADGKALLAKEVEKLTGKAASLTKTHKELNETYRPLIDKNNELWKTADLVTKKWSDYNEAISKTKLAISEYANFVPKTIQITDSLDASINKIIISSAPLGAEPPKALEKIFNAATQARKPLEDLEAAYKQLGITGTISLQQQAQEAKKAYDAINASGLASITDRVAAEAKYQAVRVAAESSSGDAITALQKGLTGTQQKELDLMLGQIKVGTEKQKGLWSDFSNEVSTIVTNLAQDLAKGLFEGGGSWADKGLNALKRLGEAVVSLFVTPFAKAASDLMAGALSDLLGGKGFGGLADRIKDIGSSISGIFGKGASGGGDILGNPVGSIPGVSGGGGASSAGGAASGAAGAGIAGIAGAVGSIAGAVSGIIGNFQNAKQETSLNAIEHNTRYSMMFLGERGDGGIVTATLKSAEYLSYLNTSVDAIGKYLSDWLSPANNALQDIMSNVRGTNERLAEISTATVKSAEYLGYLNASVDTIGKYLSDWLGPANNALQDIMSNVRGTNARLTEISTNTYLGSQSDKESSLLLSTLRDLINAPQSQGLPILNVYVNGVQAPANSVSLKMQGAIL